MADRRWVNCGWMDYDAPTEYPAYRDDFDQERIPNHAHTGTGCIFCANFEQRAKESAIAAAWSNTDKDWATKATIWIHARPQGEQFTADDLVGDIGLPEWISTNAIGALFSKMAKQHVIQAVGYTNAKRMSSHSRVLRIWERR